MQKINRLVLAAAIVLLPTAALFAQAPADPSGHWTGAIHVPAFNGASAREVGIEIDLAKNASGELAANFSQASPHRSRARCDMFANCYRKANSRSDISFAQLELLGVRQRRRPLRRR